MLTTVIFRGPDENQTIASIFTPYLSSNLCPTCQPTRVHTYTCFHTVKVSQQSSGETQAEGSNWPLKKRFHKLQFYSTGFQTWTIPILPTRGSAEFVWGSLGLLYQVKPPLLHARVNHAATERGLNCDLLMFSKHQTVLWQRPQNNALNSVLLLEKMMDWASFQLPCPDRFPKATGLPGMGKVLLCRLTICLMGSWYCTSVHAGIPESSLLKLEFRILYHYFQFCSWSITSIAKPSLFLSLRFISPSAAQKLLYLPPFMKSNRWCMIPIMYSIPSKSSKILPSGGEIDE